MNCMCVLEICEWRFYGDGVRVRDEGEDWYSLVYFSGQWPRGCFLFKDFLCHVFEVCGDDA